MTHIWVSELPIIGSDNGLAPGRRQAIIWTNAGLLLIGPLGTNFNEILIEILTFSFKKMRLKVSSAKWRPFRLGLNVLRNQIPYYHGDITSREIWFSEKLFRIIGLGEFCEIPNWLNTDMVFMILIIKPHCNKLPVFIMPLNTNGDTLVCFDLTMNTQLPSILWHVASQVISVQLWLHIFEKPLPWSHMCIVSPLPFLYFTSRIYAVHTRKQT